MSHSLDIRIYYEDTDAGGVVYYANFLKFAERGRTELLRSIGFENKSLKENEGIVFVVRHIEADYLMPAYLDDELRVETSVANLKNSSLVMGQSFFRRNDMIYDMKVTLVCVAANDLKPVRFPPDLRSGFETFLNEG